MQKFSEETIKEVEKIYGKATKAEIEQAELMLNDDSIMEAYFETIDE